MDNRQEIRDFLATRRARIPPEQAGLPVYGGHRRVPGLRREEAAMLAGVSVDYYTRLERGGLSGASESVLESLRPDRSPPWPGILRRRLHDPEGDGNHGDQSPSGSVVCPTSIT